MTTFNGSSGDDIFTGGSTGDRVYGNGGNDQLSGGDGNDVVAGNAGSDTINGGDGNDVLFSGNQTPAWNVSDSDSLTGYYGFPGATSPIVLDTGAEVDTLIGGAGDDKLFGGYGDNIDGGSYGTTGNYLFISFMGASSGVTVNFDQATQVIGGGTITGIQNVSWVQGSDFADDIKVGTSGFGYGDFAVVYAMGGDDHVLAGYYTGSMYGGDGADTVDGRPSAYLSTVDGGAGDDILYTNVNTFAAAYGGDGNDTIYSHGATYGGDGNDLIILQDTYYPGQVFGDAGDDDIRASSVGNFIVGGAGADTLTGGAGNDTLYSAGSVQYSTAAVDDMGLEHDHLSGAGGNDALAIGYGDDADGGAGTDTLRLSLGGATAGLTFSTAGIVSGQPFTLAGGTIQNIETLTYLRGTDFADVLTLATQATLLTVDAGGGNDVIYSFDSSVALSGGAGNDRFVSGRAGDTFDGGAGIDTIDYASALSGVTVNLATGSGAGGDQLVNVENIAGSSFADSLTGDASINVITGGAGNDIIDGGGGADTLDGESGVNTASFASATVGVTVSLALQGSAQTTGVGSLTLTNFQNLTGSAHADTLTGDSNNNVIDGGSGGDDILDGGGGVNTVSFASATSGVNVNLNLQGSAHATGAGLETLSNFQNLTGSAFADSLFGDGHGNVLDGGAGDDFLYGDFRNSGSPVADDVLIGGAGNDSLYTEGGNDVLDGGAGFDNAYFSFLSQGVHIDLARQGVAQNWGAGQVTLISIESVGGTTFDDVITAAGVTTAVNLSGDAGNDTLIGGAGNDFIGGGSGADLLTGGAGADTFSEWVNLSYLPLSDGSMTVYDTITDFQTGIDHISFGGSSSSASRVLIQEQAGGGAIVSFDADGDGTYDEKFVLSSGSLQGSDLIQDYGGPPRITLFGAADAETLHGGAGDDTIDGGGGNDSMDGGAGANTVSFASAASGVTVSLARQGVAQATGVGSDTLSNFKNLTGSAFADTLIGDANANVILGGGGNDVIRGGGGADTLTGGGGADTFVFVPGQVGNAAVTDFSHAEGDRIDASASSLHSMAGLQAAASQVGANTVINLGGGSQLTLQNTLLSGLTAGDFLFNPDVQGTGSGTVTGNGANGTIRGLDGDHLMYGGGGNVTMYAGNGNTVMVAGSGGFTAYGGTGSDYFYGGSHGDSAYGGGGTGTDVFVMGSGNDTVYGGGQGYAYIYGGGGSDQIHDGAGVNVVIEGAGGANTIYGGGTVDYLYGGAGTDTIYGGAGEEILILGSGSSTFYGGTGIAYYYGGSGNDFYYGGSGIDVVVAGSGTDLLNGGGGTNYFFLPAASHDTIQMNANIAGVDVVNGFNPSTGVLNLLNTGWSGLSDVLAHTYDYMASGGFSVIALNGQAAIWLIGVSPSQLTAQDFHFN